MTFLKDPHGVFSISSVFSPFFISRFPLSLSLFFFTTSPLSPVDLFSLYINFYQKSFYKTQFTLHMYKDIETLWKVFQILGVIIGVTETSCKGKKRKKSLRESHTRTHTHTHTKSVSFWSRLIVTGRGSSGTSPPPYVYILNLPLCRPPVSTIRKMERRNLLLFVVTSVYKVRHQFPHPRFDNNTSL